VKKVDGVCVTKTSAVCCEYSVTQNTAVHIFVTDDVRYFDLSRLTTLIKMFPIVVTNSDESGRENGLANRIVPLYCSDLSQLSQTVSIALGPNGMKLS